MFPIILTDLPSKFIPYSFTELPVRKFLPSDLSKAFGAAQNNDFESLVEVLGTTIDQDIKEFTVPDFYYLMYWHRLNSYTNSPFEVKWQSKYGTEEVYIVTKDNLKVDYLSITPEEYETYSEFGFRIPTVADIFEINEFRKTDKNIWLAERVQYIQGPTLQARLEMVESLGVEYLEKIREFAAKTKHGVVEDIEVTTKLNYAETVANLKTLIDDGETDYQQILAKTVARKSKKLDTETLTISMNALQFFPDI